MKSIEAKSPIQTKMMFWFLFVVTRGATNRIRIVSLLRKTPNNAHQISTEFRIDYKLVLHHLKILERDNLVKKMGNKYDVKYCVSTLFENSESVFDEIVDKLKKQHNQVMLNYI